MKKFLKVTRGKFCWLLGHRYPVIWLKGERGTRIGIPDVEAGCIYCGYTQPNKYPISAEKIDWLLTTHRTPGNLPRHNVF